ncbi:hypothetical protein BS47DRAFT_1388363 [Hydnum rufescens UP504]|uniref:Uncharacterized protein n=1 Tax=Hydnum rufescens UP504 TaxID=1448309 RepID=A0A9P6BAG9_9AGAM|nr:hypothetical protein BS47DRAFT_1388363 [Hydnum rufescens UP504]
MSLKQYRVDSEGITCKRGFVVRTTDLGAGPGLAETTAGDEFKPDESPIDSGTSKARLEKSLSHRPEKKDLSSISEDNFLDGTRLSFTKLQFEGANVAPALQAIQDELRRAQIGDAVDKSLQARVQTIAELQAAGTVTPPAKPDESPIDPESSRVRLEKSLLDRPDQKDLIQKNILKDSNVAPALQAAQEELKRAQLEDKLEHALLQRPNPAELVSEGILQESEAPPA